MQQRELDHINVLNQKFQDGMTALAKTWETIKAHAQGKEDFIATAPSLEMALAGPFMGARAVQPKEVIMDFNPDGQRRAMTLTPNAHRQLAQFLHIPAIYYDRLQEEHPDLLVTNLNTLLTRSEEKRMVRTVGDQVRAILSDRYQPRDNLDLVQAILPTLMAKGGQDYQVISADVDLNRLYLKFVSREVHFDLSQMSHQFHTSDVLFAGLTLSNNEVGNGAITVEPFFFRTWCENLAIMTTAFRKYHVGRRWDAEANIQALLTDDTRKKQDDAFFASVRDVVAASFDQLKFQAMAEAWAKAKDDVIPETVQAQKVIERVAERTQLNQAETMTALDNLIRDASLNGLNRFGVANAITSLARKTQDYDRKTDLERIGGQVIEMTAADWRWATAA